MAVAINDTVVMNAKTLRQSGNSEEVRNFKGVVVEIIGVVADVETEDGSIVSVPVAKLSVSKEEVQVNA